MAIEGIVYDLSKVSAWKDGKHSDGITAGKDLTVQFNREYKYISS